MKVAVDRSCTLIMAWVICTVGIGVPMWSAEREASVEERISKLQEEISHHDDLYFREAAPEITDYEYDLLKLELRRLEAATGLVPLSDSVGDDRLVVASSWFLHSRPMLSLAKAYSDEAVADFYEQVLGFAPEGAARFSLEPKFDGVAVSIVMERGKFVSAATRGNGARGEDISDQVRTIRSLYYEWEFDQSDPRIERIELRGEVYLSDAGFNALNAQREVGGEEPFRHPRSVAAGTVKLFDLDEVASRGLSLVIHGWGDVQPSAAEPESITAFQRWLDARGLPAVRQAGLVTPTNAAELNDAIVNLRAAIAGIPMDGIVIKVDSVAVQREMGNGPTAPRWALARKFAPARTETTLRKIVWQVGRSGTLTPVAEFDPVVLGGVTVRRASLSNGREIMRRDLRLGDTVWVEKAGEIIPQIAGVLKERRGSDSVPYALPRFCPSCSHALNENEENTQLVCGNYRCRDQVVQRLLHFGSKGALQIRGVGPVMAQRLVTAGLVHDPSDLYVLTAEQLTVLPHVGEKTAQRLLREIEGSRAASLDRWIIALGLPGVGKRGAHQLAGEINALTDLVDDSRREAALASLGPSVAMQVEDHLSRPDVWAALERLSEIANPR